MFLQLLAILTPTTVMFYFGWSRNYKGVRCKQSQCCFSPHGHLDHDRIKWDSSVMLFVVVFV